MAVYTVKQASLFLRISARRVRKLLEEKRLRGLKVGRDWFVLELNYTPMTRGKDKKPRRRRSEKS